MKPRQSPRPVDPAAAPALFDRDGVGSHRNALGELDFDEALLPWIDRPGADVAGYVDRLPHKDALLLDRLTRWRDEGFVVLERAVDPSLIDAYVADVEELFAHPDRYDVDVKHPAHPMGPLRSLAADGAHDRRLRVCDFHNASVAGKKLALARPMVDFFAHVFREQVVAMQSLTFRYGSEQDVHQDHAYVVPGNPAHLGAAWIALEDIHPDAGPLGYFPGSHRIRKFDWGNGLFYDEKRSTRWQFQEHILAECARLGLELQTFLPRKGDVFLWHGCLAHGGTPQRDPNRTRLSLAVHYSSVPAYPRASRRTDVAPTRYGFNGAVVYGDPTRPATENSFTRGFSAGTGELFLVEEP